ncbi:hypothetical protein DFH29DRAFT_784269, partial [Suillus ampliporus]
LIVGRANAGKTTILKRVCNTRENPEIRNSAGEKVRVMIPVECRIMTHHQHGEHDIENEMVFSSNEGFAVHDSRGLEAGGEAEFNKMKVLSQ